VIRYNGINHLAMATSNMDETIRFWRDLLGMRLVAGLGRPGYRHYFFEISENDMIAFFEWPGVLPDPGKWPAVQEPPPDDRKIYPGLGSEYFRGKGKKRGQA